MRDFNKFSRPKITKDPLIGDVLVKLRYGDPVNVKAKDYLRIQKFFKINSVIGESVNSAGNLKVLDKKLNKLITVSPQTYIDNQDKFEFVGIVGSKFIDPYNGHQYVDLGLPSGILWATMNIGASSETDYGNYYQYGKGAAQYAATSGDSNYSGTEDPLDSSVDTAVQVWGGSWHMPTRAQMQELTTNTTYQWVTNYKGSGINGGTFTATNGAVLFIPAAGYWYNGSRIRVGSYSYCWGSSPNGSNDACNLYLLNGIKNVLNSSHKCGYSVRPVADEILIPDGVELALTGDIIVHSNTLNKDEIFSYSDWVNLSDDWDLVGLYGITTYEEEDAANGDYVIMTNGHTLIIKPEDYNKVRRHWERVDVITKVIYEFEVWADLECTTRPTGEVNTVYVQFNKAVGFGEGPVEFSGELYSDLTISTPSDEYPQDSYNVVLWVDWESDLNRVTPFEKGDVVECSTLGGYTYNVTNNTMHFGNIVDESESGSGSGSGSGNGSGGSSLEVEEGTHEIEIYADSQCTTRPSGPTSTVYVKLNKEFHPNDYEGDELYYNDCSQGKNCDSETFQLDTVNSGYPSHKFQIFVWFDFASQYNRTTPFLKGEVVECNLPSGWRPIDVTGYKTYFGNLVVDEQESGSGSGNGSGNGSGSGSGSGSEIPDQHELTYEITFTGDYLDCIESVRTGGDDANAYGTNEYEIAYDPVDPLPAGTIIRIFPKSQNISGAGITINTPNTTFVNAADSFNFDAFWYFTMPAEDVEISVTYEAPEGSGSGSGNG